MAEVRLIGINKIYPYVDKKDKQEQQQSTNLRVTEEGVWAVQDFNLTIADKEFIVLVGPSGCGKSTILNMIAGLEDISSGELYINNELMNDVEPQDRNIAMVFQSYALYPHMTVYDNMAFSLKLKNMPKAEIDKRVREAAEILDITEYLKRKPKALSGGQRQRVAIGRAIVRDPKVFLMDEPLSNLDAKLRNQMRAEIIKLRQRINTTFVYVTHDQTEAMTLGDRIVIMKDGVVQQIGTPQQVFNRPVNKFVAGFIGMPQMNFFEANLVLNDNIYYIEIGGRSFELTIDKQENLRRNNIVSQKIIIGIRPEHVVVKEFNKDCFVGEIDVSEMLGSTVNLHVKVFNVQAIFSVQTMELMQPEYSFTHGDKVYFDFNPRFIHLFDIESGYNLE